MKKITSIPYLGRHSELTFSPDGKYLFHAEGTDAVALKVPLLTHEFSLKGTWDRAYNVIFHQTKPLAIVLGYGTKNSDEKPKILIYNWRSGDIVEQISIDDEGMTPAIFVGDNLLAYASDRVYLYSLSEQKPIAVLSENEEFETMSLHPNGRTLIFSQSDQQCLSLQIMDLLDHTVPIGEKKPSELYRKLEELNIQLETANISSAIFSPDGKFFVITYTDVLFFNYPERHLIRAINPDGKIIDPYFISFPIIPPIPDGRGSIKWSNAVFSPDSRFLYCGSHDGFIYRWDVSSGELVEKTLANKSPAWHIGVYDSNLKTIVGHEKTIANSNPVWQLAISPDGQLLASSGREHSLTLWDLSL